MFKLVVDGILNFLYDFVEPALMLLPDSPFQQIEFEVNQWISTVLGWINYFVPIASILVFTTTYLIAVFAWYVVRWILRLGRYIQ